MNKFSVLKQDDIDKLLDDSPYLGNYIDELTSEIKEIRYNEGRITSPKYIVINQDEHYANEIIEILKRNGHWE